jgi:aspartate carbamoyltransferase catalytic subunit
LSRHLGIRWIGSLIAAPITQKEERMGVFVLFDRKTRFRERKRRFRNEELDLLTLIARQITPAIVNAKLYNNLEEAITDADCVMMLRIQRERQGATLIPSVREYCRFFGLTEAKLKLAREDAIVMHPGPINRGVEMVSTVVDGPQNVILDQVENGVAVRMALLYLVAGGEQLKED